MTEFMCCEHEYRGNKPCPKCSPKDQSLQAAFARVVHGPLPTQETEQSLGEQLRQKRLANGITMLETADKTMIEYLDAIRKYIEGGEYNAASYLARSLQVHLDKANTLANLLAELDK